MRKTVLLSILILVLVGAPAQAAYHHMGEEDAAEFLEVYPEKAGTKLDRCALCHRGGEVVRQSGQVIKMGSCQWCHSEYGYDASGDITKTMNQYGLDYLNAGRNAAAIAAIGVQDSDGDGYSNEAEIAADRYPGDPEDDPTKTPAPYRVYSRDQLKTMTGHTQFLLMNTSKSGDFYAEYKGIRIDRLFDRAGVLDTATGLTVFAPDGWSTYHPMYPTEGLYHAVGEYPAAVFHYANEADAAVSEVGWCDYSAASCNGRNDNDPIEVQNGLRLMLAYLRDGENLTVGQLNEQNKLDGEGPFRVIPPQLVPCPPDQASTSDHQDVIWPYNYDADHNAGYASRSAAIIRVEPLPEGVTDLDIFEAGWDLVDNAEVVVYGAIAADDTTPQVTAKGTTDGGVNSQVTATFSEPVQGSTVTQNTFLVEVISSLQTDNTPVSGQVTYNAETMTAVFTPDQALSKKADYRATLTTGIQDLAGNPLPANVSWNFSVTDKSHGSGSGGCFLNMIKP